MSASSQRADEWRIREYRQRAAVRLVNQLVEVGKGIGLTDEQLVETITDVKVRRATEQALQMRVRSEETWAWVAAMLPGALARASAPPVDPFTRLGI